MSDSQDWFHEPEVKEGYAREDGDSDFDRWIEELQVDVVQLEYGYEEGEFTVTPELWRPIYDEGLTPMTVSV